MFHIENDPRIKVRIRTGTSENPPIYLDRFQPENQVLRQRNFSRFSSPQIHFSYIGPIAIGNIFENNPETLQNILHRTLNEQELKKDESRILNCDSVPIIDSDLEKECGVCRENFSKGDFKSILPCLHSFHTSCISEWVKYKPICPFCREKLP